MENISERVSRVEEQIDTLQGLVNDERIAIDNLRGITAEHSKQIEQLGKSIDMNSKNINKLYIIAGKLEEKTSNLVDKVDTYINITTKQMDDFRKFAEFSLQLNKSVINTESNKTLKAEEKQLKYNAIDKVIDVIAKLALIALVVLLGAHAFEIFP